MGRSNPSAGQPSAGNLSPQLGEDLSSRHKLNKSWAIRSTSMTQSTFPILSHSWPLLATLGHVSRPRSWPHAAFLATLNILATLGHGHAHRTRKNDLAAKGGQDYNLGHSWPLCAFCLDRMRERPRISWPSLAMYCCVCACVCVCVRWQPPVWTTSLYATFC